jgi:hypothetical protein
MQACIEIQGTALFAEAPAHMVLTVLVMFLAYRIKKVCIFLITHSSVVQNGCCRISKMAGYREIMTGIMRLEIIHFW